MAGLARDDSETIESPKIHKVKEIPVLKAIKIKKARIRFKSSLVLKIAILFVLGLLIIIRFARITELGYQTNAVLAQYDTVVLENQNLRVNIEKSIDLPKIRQHVEENLNLHQPGEGQIVYINTAATDRVDYADGSQEEEKNVIQNVWNWIKEFLGLVD